MEKNDQKYDIFPCLIWPKNESDCISLPSLEPYLFCTLICKHWYFKFLADYFKMCGEHCILLSPMKKVNYPFWPQNKAFKQLHNRESLFSDNPLWPQQICRASNQKFCSDHRKEVIMAICQATQKIFFVQHA